MNNKETASASDRGLREDIKEFKDPKPYREHYESPEVQELVQAIDIIERLAQSASLASTKVGVYKLLNAKKYLDEQLKEYLEQK